MHQDSVYLPNIYIMSEAEFIGIYCETYLLESSRVISKPRDERNFHIPYMLYYGISSDQHDHYGILHPHQWRYTNNIEYEIQYLSNISGVKDAERFHELKEAMVLFRIDEDIQDKIWRIVSAIFNLGNINFKKTEEGIYAEIDPCIRNYFYIYLNK